MRRDDDLLESWPPIWQIFYFEFHKIKMFRAASMLVSWTLSLWAQESWTVRFEKFYNKNHKLIIT